MTSQNTTVLTVEFTQNSSKTSTLSLGKNGWILLLLLDAYQWISMAKLSFLAILLVLAKKQWTFFG